MRIHVCFVCVWVPPPLPMSHLDIPHVVVALATCPSLFLCHLRSSCRPLANTFRRLAHVPSPAHPPAHPAAHPHTFPHSHILTTNTNFT